MQNDHEGNEAFVALTAEVVCAYVTNNPVPVVELPSLIEGVYRAMAGLSTAAKVAEPEQAQKPAVNPKKSVFDDHIVCLEDGKKFKSMRRHLMKLGLTPDEYRAKWNLPSDYPMVAPSYAKARSEMAKSMGLGRKPGDKVKQKVRKKAA